MQLSKVFKGLMIAVPVLAMTACSSTDDAVNAEGSSTDYETSQPAGEGSTSDNTVVSPIEGGEGALSEQELQEKALAETSTIYFAFDNASIAGDYEEVLAAHASFLVSNPAKNVTVEGHADERGTPEYNIALGERRAVAVAKYLQALGVQPEQVSIVSYGEEKPLVFGQSEEAYAKNRRAVLVY